MKASFEDQVRVHAYHIWLAGGMVHGRAHEHWVCAEQEMKAAKPVVIITKANAAKVEITKADTTKAKPSAKKAVAAKPAKAKAAAKSATAKPVASKPVTSKPVTAQKAGKPEMTAH